MLVQETLPNGLVKTYSNAGLMIKQIETGELYEEAIDIPYNYTYNETDIKIEQEEQEINEDSQD
jgi:hypothetical protein